MSYGNKVTCEYCGGDHMQRDCETLKERSEVAVATGSVLSDLHTLAEKVGDVVDWAEQDSSCIKCHTTMGLDFQCEWPDDPRLLLCGSCAVEMLGRAIFELEKLNDGATRQQPGKATG
jgi:hypothetical protein